MSSRLGKSLAENARYIPKTRIRLTRTIASVAMTGRAQARFISKYPAA